MEAIHPPSKISASDFQILADINPDTAYVFEQISLLRQNKIDIGFHYQ